MSGGRSELVAMGRRRRPPLRDVAGVWQEIPYVLQAQGRGGERSRRRQFLEATLRVPPYLSSERIER